MPLEKGKSQKAFVHNLKAEMHAGKPQKQSLAIAYSMKRKAQHKKTHGGDMCAHGGPMECNVGCYAEGGSVDSWTKRSDNEKGINKPSMTQGKSEAGAALHPAYSVAEDLDVHAAKRKHQKVLGEMRSMPKPKLMADGGDSGELDSMGFPKEEPKPKKPPSTATTSTSSSNPIGYPQGASLAEGGMMKSKRERAMEAFYAEGGGSVKGVHTSPDWQPEKGKSYAGTAQRAGNTANSDEERSFQHGEAKEEHQRVLGEMKSMKKPNLMAEGGYIGSYQSHEKPEIDGDLMPAAHLEQELAEHIHHAATHDSSHEHDVMNQMGDEDEGAGDMDAIHPMVMRIMMGRAKGYSEGGKVANEESGESTDEPTMAKADGNEFDDLALRDDLEFKDTGANSGDMDDDAKENHDRDDIVSRIMKSRSKRDRMAVSGEGSTYGKGK